MIYKTTTFFLAFVFLISCGNTKDKSVIQEKNKNKILDTLSGFYKTEVDPNDSADCELSVEIIKNKKGYIYHLKTSLRDLKGKISITRDESNELYLVLEGIPWDEYLGDVSNETDDNETKDDVKKENVKTPVGIDASVATDTLTIQNYGNSMNNYTKIGECGRKYIVLIKQKVSPATARIPSRGN